MKRAMFLMTMMATSQVVDVNATEPPYGFGRSDTGREYQTHFDLRQRWMWGGGAIWAGEDVGGVVQTSALYEYLDDWDGTRDRHEFMAADVRLDGLELDATLYSFERRRMAKEPMIWLTKLVGDPQRYDLHLNVGPAVTFAEVSRRNTELGDETRVNVGQLGAVLALFQTKNLEDGVWFRFMAGGGVNARGEDAKGFFMPSARLQGRWSPGERGLWQFSSSAGVRYGYEPTGTNWLWLDGQIEVDRVLFAVNDQPFSLFVQGRAEAFDGVRDWDVSGLVGLRVNLFSPPPERSDLCGGETESSYALEVDGGCRRRNDSNGDSDSDGVLDFEDSCPMDAGPATNFGCPQVYDAQ